MDIHASTEIADLRPTFDRLRAAQQRRVPDYAQRRDDLQRLRAAFKARIDGMVAAIQADFGRRSRHEIVLSEAMTVLGEIDHMLGGLRGLMRPERRPTSWLFWPGRCEVRHQPLGLVGVMAPWNYPVNLALAPLVAAIAAGNHVFVKPSESTPHTAAWIRDLLTSVFPDDRVAVALGGPEVAAAFAALPFDHLLFTGSTAVGRKIMAAAAPNLTPVTLELGGKSPAIIAEDYPIDTAAARIATGKWFNGGQTCIAPDYILLPEAKLNAFVEALRGEVTKRFPDLATSADYTAVVNEAQYGRLRGYVDDARTRGFDVVELASIDAAQGQSERIIPPTLILGPDDEAKVMRDEIFGPILPIKTYRRLDEAIDYVNAHDRPLALYHFDLDRARTREVLERTTAGGVTVNDTLLHFGQDALPFGGVGPSGMGAYHGKQGFHLFSHAKSVFYQARWSGLSLFTPPYRGLADFLAKFLSR
ncbi:MAG: coniferyl aldehyde dehydrogenase [Xanthomonadales bacterium]|nr:coniferyl aldehyde dehydrogenase [Xanthomonadales bacterium]